MAFHFFSRLFLFLYRFVMHTYAHDDDDVCVWHTWCVGCVSMSMSTFSMLSQSLDKFDLEHHYIIIYVFK